MIIINEIENTFNTEYNPEETILEFMKRIAIENKFCYHN